MVTGGTRQSDVYSDEEQTCLVCNIKLLCVHPMKQPNCQAIVLSDAQEAVREVLDGYCRRCEPVSAGLAH